MLITSKTFLSFGCGTLDTNNPRTIATEKTIVIVLWSIKNGFYGENIDKWFTESEKNIK